MVSLQHGEATGPQYVKPHTHRTAHAAFFFFHGRLAVRKESLILIECPGDCRFFNAKESVRQQGRGAVCKIAPRVVLQPDDPVPPLTSH